MLEAFSQGLEKGSGAAFKAVFGVVTRKTRATADHLFSQGEKMKVLVLAVYFVKKRA